MEILTITLSLISLVISLSAILWTIYEKIYLKPRSRVTGQISFIKQGKYESESMVSLTIINLGPGKIIIESIVAQNKKLFGKMFKRNKYAFIMHDYLNAANPTLPHEIDQYKSMTQFLPINREKLFDVPMNKFGFKDSIGRLHFMNRRQFKILSSGYARTVEKLKKHGKIFDT
jgi:hypothetical protein